MSWIEWHRKSESLASEAYLAYSSGDFLSAETMYAKAAKFEKNAFDELDSSKPRTLSVVAVSVASLFLKASLLDDAEKFSLRVLASFNLLDFAEENLKKVVQEVWIEKSKKAAGVQFVPGQVTVSIKGGSVVYGGAPLDLVVEKVQTLQAMFYRTVEFIQGMPHRLRGGPSQEVESACKPWLFQAPPGSYQFSIAIQKPVQMDFFRTEVEPDRLAHHFLEIVKATTLESSEKLSELVPDEDYRSTFLKLSRNLSPTGKAYERMDISSSHGDIDVALVPETRAIINRNIGRRGKERNRLESVEEVIKGNLRAVHLDSDWIEIGSNGSRVQVFGLKEAVDDVIGPMVNREVIVRATRSKEGKLKFVDIELQE